MERETTNMNCVLSIGEHVSRASPLLLGKPGEMSPTAESMEPGEDKYVTVPGIKWADQNLKSEPGLLATTYLNNRGKKSLGHRLKRLSKGSE